MTKRKRLGVLGVISGIFATLMVFVFPFIFQYIINKYHIKNDIWLIAYCISFLILVFTANMSLGISTKTLSKDDERNELIEEILS